MEKEVMVINGWSSEKGEFWDELNKINPNYEKQRFNSEAFLEIVIGEQEIINFQEDEDITKTIVKAQIRKETEKAVDVLIESTTQEYWDGELEDEYTEKYAYWLPKSQIKIEDGKITLPEWLAKKNQLVNKGKKISVVTVTNL